MTKTTQSMLYGKYEKDRKEASRYTNRSKLKEYGSLSTTKIAS